MATTGEKKSQRGETSPVSIAYLIAYNVAQVLGWSAIMLTMISHFVREQDNNGLYVSVAPLLNIFQTAAILEIIHCAVGLVRSNWVLTTFQVASRIGLTWGIVYSVESVQDIFGVTMFLFAWTVTEIIRYLFYVFALIGRVPYFIQWCRYSLFIVLYPIGVMGELLSMINSLDYVRRSRIYSVELPNRANMSFSYYYFLIFSLITYIPGFPKLYMHMLAQRRKVIGGETKSKQE